MVYLNSLLFSQQHIFCFIFFTIPTIVLLLKKYILHYKLLHFGFKNIKMNKIDLVKVENKYYNQTFKMLPWTIFYNVDIEHLLSKLAMCNHAAITINTILLLIFFWFHQNIIVNVFFSADCFYFLIILRQQHY